MYDSSLKLSVEVATNYCLLIEHMGNPLITSLTLENHGETAFHELELGIKVLTGDRDTWSVPLPSLPGGRSLEIENIQFRIGLDILQQVIEDENFLLQLTINKKKETLLQDTKEFKIQAYNTINWSESPKESYACFVTPNHPIIAQILKQTSKTLLQQNLSGSLEGYQGRSAQRVEQMAKALYETFAEFDISYINPPSGQWSGGQRIRLPDQVLTESLGTCADLTPLAASCLEQMGLYSIIISVRGHVYPGVFLREDIPQRLPAVIEDLELIRALIESEYLLLFDSSTYAQQPQPPFSSAVQTANNYLAQFEYAINIFEARRSGFTPLPVRLKVAVDSEEEVLSIAQQILRDAAKNLAYESNNRITDIKTKVEPVNAVVSSRLQSWKEKLLDLSTRNRLLHMSNLDFSRIYCQTFIEEVKNFLEVFVANAIADENLDVAMYLTDLHSKLKVERLLSKGFSFENQFDIGYYVASLLEIIEQPDLQKIILELLQKYPINPNQKAFKKIQQNLKKGKASFIFLHTPPGLLGSLEDQIYSGRSLELIAGREQNHGAEAIAFVTKELAEGYCQTYLVIGTDTGMPESLLFQTGRTLAKEARISEEENGASPLYLAFGLLQWIEPKSSTPRLAPLLLYPIELKADTKQRQVRIKRSKGEPVGNITLVEKLKRDCDLDLSILANPPEDDNGIDLEKLFDQIREVVLMKSGWKVIETAIITNFTFGKFLLWKDLQDNTEHLLKNELVHHIASAGRDPFTDPLPDLNIDSLDQEPYRDLPLVVNSDSSQLAAVYAALKGRSFILQGPPGTGKSQTITNLIAACMGAGKSVLFVAEKQAAVEVVHRRLMSVGLGSFCLDLHSQNRNRMEVLSSFDEALQQQSMGEPNWSDFCRQLESSRVQLRQYANALHTTRKIGFSLFEMLSWQAKLSRSQLSLKLPPSIQTQKLTEQNFHNQIQQIRDFVKTVQEGEDNRNNPWQFLTGLDWSLALDQQLEVQLPDTQDGVEQLQVILKDHFFNLSSITLNWEQCMCLATIAKFAPLETLPSEINECNQWEPLKQQAKHWLDNLEDLEQQSHQLGQYWQEEIFEQNLEQLAEKSKSLLSAFVLIRWVAGFFFKRQLKPLYKGKIPGLRELHKQIRSLQAIVQLRQQVEQDRQYLEQVFPNWNKRAEDLNNLINQYQTVFLNLHKLHATGISVNQLLQIQADHWIALKQSISNIAVNFHALKENLKLEEFPPPSKCTLSLNSVSEWLGELISHRRGLRSWCQYSRLRSEFKNSSIGPILNWYESGIVPLEELASTYQAIVLKLWFQECFDSEKCLREFSGDRHNASIKNFQQLERDYLNLSRHFIREKVLSRFPNLNGLLPGSELAELKREMTKKRGHFPIRTLFQRIPNLLPVLKPCLLMSPISVAQCLPADGRNFDLIIFDEASQIETHDAIGTIARGKQLIVVGDNKQMPPSNFFGRSGENVETILEDNVEDLESILDEAIACNLPEQMLQWHYRSRHESLILFSNQHYYENKLNLFPAATQSRSDLGLKWHPIPRGFYKPGERVNEEEGKALVSYLFTRLQQHKPGEHSFGIITFSTPQQLLIEQLIEAELQNDSSLEVWFDKSNLEYCFIKNLETVQGDERDEILFSICFAPQPNGKLSMNFGPLNRLGGERRLNVAITRARTALHIFSTLTAEHIDLNRTNALAVRHLKEFLALTARLDQESEDLSTNNKSFDSEIQRQIYTVLTEAGYKVDCQIGCAEYRIDFGIQHPERQSHYVLGIECDGASYIAAATVRDRDCLRQSVLNNMGWNMYRVWSIDWLLDRSGAERRLLQAVEKAMKNIDQVEAASLNISNEQLTTVSTVNQLTSISLASSNQGTIKASSTDSMSSFSQQNSLLEIEEVSLSLGKPYEVANLDLVSEVSKEFYEEASTSLITELLLEIVKVESPISLPEAAQRLTQCWSFGRFTKRALKRVSDQVDILVNQGKIFVDDEVLWQNQQQYKCWQGFRSPPSQGRKLNIIPKIEIIEAMISITQTSLSILTEDLLRETLRQLTLTNRLSNSQRQILQPILDELIECNRLKQSGDRISN